MGWILAYLVCAFVVTTLFGIIWMSNSNDAKLSISTGEEAFMMSMFCLFWVITVPILSFDILSKWYRKKRKDTAEGIVSRYRIGSDRHDRSHMVEIPEHKLKYVLKAYRKKSIDLTSIQVEMIREELMHRMTERDLLR